MSGKALSLAAVLIASLVIAVPSADAKQHRSSSAKHEFQHLNPCPSTGGVRGSCPGYIIDHIVPLCAGGPDRPSNMQWQTVQEAKKKDRLERQQCRQSKFKT